MWLLVGLSVQTEYFEMHLASFIKVCYKLCGETSIQCVYFLSALFTECRKHWMGKFNAKAKHYSGYRSNVLFTLFAADDVQTKTKNKLSMKSNGNGRSNDIEKSNIEDKKKKYLFRHCSFVLVLNERKASTTSNEKYKFGKLCFLFCSFLPMGKYKSQYIRRNNNVIVVIVSKAAKKKLTYFEHRKARTHSNTHQNTKKYPEE